MFDPQKLLDQFLGADPGAGKPAVSSDTLKGLAGGAAAGGLVAILLGSKGGRELAGGALKLGGAAVLGGIAYRAWQNWQATKSAQTTVPMMKDITPQEQAQTMLPSTPQAKADLSLSLIRAMIAAAKADGHIDQTEQKHIFDKLDQLNLNTEAKAFVMDELRKPLDIDAVVSAAKTPEAAMEIYTASVLAIDPDDPAERAYLTMLASRLKLDPGLAATIEKEAQAAVAG